MTTGMTDTATMTGATEIPGTSHIHVSPANDLSTNLTIMIMAIETQNVVGGRTTIVSDPEIAVTGPCLPGPGHHAADAVNPRGSTSPQTFGPRKPVRVR